MAKTINLDFSAQEKKTIQFFGSDYMDYATILCLSGIWEHASFTK